MKMLLPAFIATICLLMGFTPTDGQVTNLAKHPDPRVAQHQRPTENNPCVLTILQQQYARRAQGSRKAAARTSAATGERLKSFCGYNLQDTSFLPYGKSDSAYYFYSSSHSSVFDYQMMAYAAPSSATYTSPVSLDYPLSLTWDPAYGGAFAQELLPDSVYSWNSFYPLGLSGAMFGFADITAYTYGGSAVLRVADNYYPDLPGEQTREDYAYDTAGHVISTVYSSFDTTLHAWDTTMITSWYYNGYNQLVMDSASLKSGGIWGEYSKTTYLYDGNGNLVFTEFYTDSSGYWQPQTMRMLQYNADSTLRSDSESQYNPGQWTPYLRDSFGYSSGIPYFTYDQTEMYVSDSVWSKCTYTKHVNGSGLPDTLFYAYYGGSYAPVAQQAAAKKTSFVYDAAGNPVLATCYDYVLTDTLSGTGAYNTSPERFFRYYYETYDVTAVRETVPEGVKLTAYPNPAGNVVNVVCAEAAPGTRVTITITNAAGQMVRTESLAWRGPTVTIPLGGLAPGMYLLTAVDGTGKMLGSQKIVKH